MRDTDLTDEQWKRIRPLLPPPRKGRGRPLADDRRVLNGILFVLRTGCRWEDVPQEYASPATCWRRLLATLDGQGKLEWARAFLDGSFVPAKRGIGRRRHQAGQGDEGDGGSGREWSADRAALGQCTAP